MRTTYTVVKLNYMKHYINFTLCIERHETINANSKWMQQTGRKGEQVGTERKKWSSGNSVKDRILTLLPNCVGTNHNSS